MNQLTVKLWSGLAVMVVAVGLCRPASAAEEATVKVFSAWQGQGGTFQTGPKEATFVGVLTGRMYAETEKGPIESGLMVCPGTLKIGLEDGKQTGAGACTITAKDGAQIYAEIACTGVYLVGCNGDLKLTGGTGRFEGISGGGKMILRSSFLKTTSVSTGVVKDEGTGILYVQELHYKIP